MPRRRARAAATDAAPDGAVPRGGAAARVLTTPRLVLRPPRPDDVDAFYGWASDPRMMAHMGRGPWSRAEVEEGMERWLGHWGEHGFGVWVAEDRAGGEPVGRCGLSYHRAWPEDPEAGWWIAPERWGQGLATEAGAAAVAYGFETLGFEKLTEVRSPLWPDLVLWIHARAADPSPAGS